MAKKDSPIKLKQDADAAEKSGRFDRAIELLKQIVADNPRDWNTVNRIGDLYAKINKLKEANEQYVKYASYLAEDGFYLKSIAVWKKVLRNDPSLIEAQLKLGELYARQGLAAEARQTFDGVFNEYVKRNRMREAGEVLRRAAEVDPGDLKVRIKLAELYAREGDQGRAAKEYGAIGDELVKKGHHAEALQLIDKALRSGPRSPHLLAAAAQIHIVQKDYPRAIELLEEARRANPADRDVSLRMAEAYLGARRAQEARRVLEALLQRDSNDQDARQQLGQVYVFEGRYDEAFDHLLPVVDKLVEKRQVDRGAALLQGLVQRNPQHFKSLAKLVELYRLSRNDILVAQTYGQMVEAYMAQAAHEQAASILDMLVQLEPHNEQHRTKLKWLRDQKGVAGGGPAPTDLKPASESMVAVPPVPAARLGLELSPPLSPDDHEFISEHLAEGRVFRKYGLGDKARDQFEAVIGRFPDNLEALSELADIAKEKGDTAGAAQRLRVMAEVHRLKGEADKAARADADADALAGPVAAPAAAPAPIAPPPPPAAAPPIALIPPVALAPPPAEMDVDISLEEPVPAPSPPEEELEYVEMPADAHAGQAPEFDAADLAPAGEIGSQYIEEEAQTLVPDSAFDLEEAPAPLPLVPVGLRAPAHVAPPPASDVPADLRRALEEIETYVSMGFVDDARSVLAEVGGRFSAHPALQQRLAELGLELEAPSDMDALLGEAPAVAPAEPEEPSDEPLQLGEGFLEFTPSTKLPTAPVPEAPAAAGDGEGFDIASELGDLFGAQAAVAEEHVPGSSTDLGDASLSDIFREFKKGVDKQLGKEDYETRYNLGIAYKEMGLVDEAIAEFQLAAKDEGRLLECASMLGICFIEKGMPKLAIKWFEKGLQAPGRRDEEYQGLRYDLASALEQAGENARALALFTELYGQDASFRDVADKVRQLGG
ncbi:MAG TPA: tetratricopeptide repeat protein [Vicinamibacteria bacterium]